MLELCRTVRFAVNDAPEAGVKDPNTFAGSPSIRGLGRHYELEVRCRGEPEPLVEYLLDIKEVDHAVRLACIPAIEASSLERGSTPAGVLRSIMEPLNHRLGGRLASARWKLSPYHSLEMEPARTDRVIIRQVFDFAASHRLHVPAWSDAENARRFGKCNNPRGHGHNYRLEPAVAVRVDASGLPSWSLQELERVVEDSVLARFDHKNLNEDTEEFATGRGAVPTVERIAQTCFDLLQAAMRPAGDRASLLRVTVWETDRTSCTYPA